MKQTLLLFSTIFFVPQIALAQAGSLDSTFNAAGYVTTAIDNGDDNGNAMAIQADGKIVVAGESYNGNDFDVALSRFNVDGTIDNSFGTNGKVTVNLGNIYDTGKSVAIQVDGKIVVVGNFISALTGLFKLCVLRFNSNGTPDNTFTSGGIDSIAVGTYSVQANSTALQSDGKIVIAGNTSNGSDLDFLVIRLNTDGTFDAGFGTNGVVVTQVGNSDDVANAVAIQPDGKIVVAGKTNTAMAVVRYNSDGTLDNTFSSDGKVTTSLNGNDKAFAVAVQSDGKIVVCGETLGGNSYDMAVVRYTAAGVLDNTFSTDGKLTTPLGSAYDGGYAIAVQEDGKIIVAGKTAGSPDDNVAVVRYTTSGALDNTFGTNGKVSTDISGHGDAAFGMALQADEKIVVAGYSNNGTNNDFLVLRYLSGINVGIDDLAADNGTPLIYPNPVKDAANVSFTLRHDGKVTLQLQDLSGNILHSFFQQRVERSGKHTEKLSLPPSLISGNYLLRIETEEGTAVVKLTKQ